MALVCRKDRYKEKGESTVHLMGTFLVALTFPIVDRTKKGFSLYTVEEMWYRYSTKVHNQPTFYPLMVDSVCCYLLRCSLRPLYYYYYR